MLYINFSLLWSFVYFFYLFYVIIVFCVILYLLPTVRDLINYSKFKKINGFEYVLGMDLYWLFMTFLFFFLITNFSWVSSSVTAWFGNIIFSNFQLKLAYLVIFFFHLVILVYATSFYFSSKQLYDFIIVTFNFFYWIYFLFFVNNVFTLVFFIEILSTLIFLLLVVSTFSSTYFYNNLDLNLHNYFNNNMPFFYLQTLMYFFWISLVTSLNLFFSIILFYLKFLTFDWFIIEFIFFYIINLHSSKDIFFIFFIWFNFLFCIFLKCGLVPFFFWKPIFFKGIPLHTLFFYIFFFYFFFFLFIIYFFLIYVNELFFFFSVLNVFLLLFGLLVLLFILCEAYYIKVFLALSSILNTLFVFLALNGYSTEAVLFF